MIFIVNTETETKIKFEEKLESEISYHDIKRCNIEDLKEYPTILADNLEIFD